MGTSGGGGVGGGEAEPTGGAGDQNGGDADTIVAKFFTGVIERGWLGKNKAIAGFASSPSWPDCRVARNAEAFLGSVSVCG
jgi:hypothetical protein